MRRRATLGDGVAMQSSFWLALPCHKKNPPTAYYGNKEKEVPHSYKEPKLKTDKSLELIKMPVKPKKQNIK